jgi:hypothetical protein
MAALGIAAAISVASVASVEAAAQAATSISVSPVRVELQLTPGKPVTQTYTIRAGASPVTVTTGTTPFTIDANGNPTTAKVPAAESGVEWVKLPGAFKLGAGQSRTVAVTVTEPKAAMPGQRYIGVIWQASAKATNAKGTAVNVAGAVASEIIADVPGKTVNDTLFGLSVPGLTWGNSVPATISADNKGNTYDLLDAQAVSVNGSPQMIGGMLVLGGAQRQLSAPVRLSWGVNHVSYQGQTRTVYALPGQYMAYGGGFLLLILGVVFLARRSGARAARR